MQMILPTTPLTGFHPFLAFGIPSGPDLIILLVIVLVLFGAKRLPELARGLGQSVNEFKKAKDEFDKEVAKPSSSPEAATPATSVAGEATSVAPAVVKEAQKPS
jgi:TatA/E family protein of Tat protein translocase